jgi:hypothetical protein
LATVAGLLGGALPLAARRPAEQPAARQAA